MTATPRCRAAVPWAVALALALALALGALLSPLTSAPAHAADACTGADCDVVPDPDDAEYVGTGGLLLPGDSFTGTSDDRTAAATCGGCRWALLPMCRGDGHGGGVDCGPAASSCPPGEFRRIVMLLRPGDGEWRVIGLVCLTPAGPTTVADVADRLHDVVVEQVPEQHPSSQPRGGTLIRLPAIFASGQPRALGARQFTLVGFEVVLQGRATWVWRFGDGDQTVTTDPGGKWPDMSVSHVYDDPGTYEVDLTTEWQAWFTVDGMGPFVVDGDPVTQVSPPLELTVREARAELVVG